MWPVFAKDRTVCDVSLSLIYIKKQLDSKKKQRKRSENDHSSDRHLDQEVYCKRHPGRESKINLLRLNKLILVVPGGGEGYYYCCYYYYYYYHHTNCDCCCH